MYFFQRCVDLYCTECHIITCSLCHLMHHQNHEYEIIENYGLKIKKEILTKKTSLLYVQNNVINSYLIIKIEKLCYLTHKTF